MAVPSDKFLGPEDPQGTQYNCVSEPSPPTRPLTRSLPASRSSRIEVRVLRQTPVPRERTKSERLPPAANRVFLCPRGACSILWSADPKRSGAPRAKLTRGTSRLPPRTVLEGGDRREAPDDPQHRRPNAPATSRPATRVKGGAASLTADAICNDIVAMSIEPQGAGDRDPRTATAPWLFPRVHRT
jgi:hypothetical protein